MLYSVFAYQIDDRMKPTDKKNYTRISVLPTLAFKLTMSGLSDILRSFRVNAKWMVHSRPLCFVLWHFVERTWVEDAKYSCRRGTVGRRSKR
jgi:hypothetical protein